MYNILEVEDKIKGFPDQALMKEAQFPSGDVPQFLIVSELQRRNEMRKSYSAMQEPAQTVPIAQQVVAEASQGVAGMMGGNPMLPPPMQAQAPMQAPMRPPMQPQMQPPMAAPMQPPMPRPQAPAGIVGMQDGRTVPGVSSGSPGVGNNNPFNIKDFNQNWRGQTGATDGFVDFSSTDYGIRAADRLLGNYDANTIRDIISKYAPDSENNTEGYINFVSNFLNIPEDAPIDLNDPDARRSVLSAIAKMETGSNISPLEISDAVSRLTPSGGGQMKRSAAARNTARAAEELSAKEIATRNLDYANSLKNPAGVTEFLGDYAGLPYGIAMDAFDSSSTNSSQNINTSALLSALGLKDTEDPEVITDPPPPPKRELAGYNAGIMELTKSGRESIAAGRSQLSALDPYEPTFTERNYITDNIDRQSYIDRLSSVAGEDVASREGLIDELQEKSKKDALSAFLMSFGAGVAGGDLSGGLEKGSKAAQDIKQVADKRLFDERKSMRDVKSAAEREAIQLGLSAEEAGLAGRRAEQAFGADQEALRNTVEFQSYQTARQQLLDNISGAREDVTTIATLIKNEADIVNDANRILADVAREAGTERRSIRDYIGDLVKAQRDTLEASVAGLTDPSSITRLVDGYRSALERQLGLPSSGVSGVSGETAVDELVDTAGFSINKE